MSEDISISNIVIDVSSERDLQNIIDVNRKFQQDTIFILGLRYPVIIRDGAITMGCATKTIKEWEELTDREAVSIAGKKAAKFWQDHRDIVLSMARISPSAASGR